MTTRLGPSSLGALPSRFRSSSRMRGAHTPVRVSPARAQRQSDRPARRQHEDVGLAIPQRCWTIAADRAPRCRAAFAAEARPTAPRSTRATCRRRQAGRRADDDRREELGLKRPRESCPVHSRRYLPNKRSSRGRETPRIFAAADFWPAVNVSTRTMWSRSSASSDAARPDAIRFGRKPEVLRANHTARREHRGPRQAILQLAHVAAPFVVESAAIASSPMTGSG